MLLLSRKVGQRILIGDRITITVCHIQRDQVRLGIDAPREIAILRPEAKAKEKQPSPKRNGQ